MDYLLIAAVFAVIYLVSVVASKSIDSVFAAMDAERERGRFR